ncbi:MAG: thiol reductant ABC exporter subunit CydD [Microbacteriaceae bacterium]
MTTGPVDPRLLHYASTSRWFFVAGAVTAFAQTVAMIGSAWFATDVIVGIIDGRAFGVLGPSMLGFGLSVGARALSVWLGDAVAARGGAQVTSQLRMRAIDSMRRRGPGWLATQNSTAVTTVVSTGLDALDGYFTKYLPQLILTVIATPILIGVLLMVDVATGIIVIITLPIIPLFMILIGWATQAVQKSQWSALTVLASSFLETVAGLATLKVFGRQHRQAARIEVVTEEYRLRTMSVLRVSFLSSFVLELAGSLSVALVAVSIGVRLVDGQLPLAVGLFALLLTPEAYLPLRQVGAQFHAAADGVAAADSVFEILDGVADSVGTQNGKKGADTEKRSEFTTPRADRPTGNDAVLAVSNFSVGYDGRTVVDSLTAQFLPGRMTVIAGPSGTGKSTLIAAILGFTPSTGSVTFGGDTVTPSQVREFTSWAGQRPSLMEGTVADNVAIGSRAIDEQRLREAMRLASAEFIDPWQKLGVNGQGLSVGQSHRVALARALYRALERSSPVVILDEPSAALDEATEGELIRGLKNVASTGRVVIVISHRPAFVQAADSVLELRRGLVPTR